MRISVKDKSGETHFGVDVSLKNPATVIHPPDGVGHPITLDWERALDDHGHLRHCIICGCPDLYVRKTFPQLTAFTLVILAAVIAIVLYGFDRLLLAIGALLLVLVVDVVIYLLSPRVLTCHNCGSDYRNVRIPPGQPRWEGATAERYRGAGGAKPGRGTRR